MKLDTSSWYMCSIVVVALPCIVRVGGDEAADSEDGQWEVFKGGKKDNQEDTVKKAINPWEKCILSNLNNKCSLKSILLFGSYLTPTPTPTPNSHPLFRSNHTIPKLQYTIKQLT